MEASNKSKNPTEEEVGIVQAAHSLSKIHKVIVEKHNKNEDFGKDLEKITVLVSSEDQTSVLLAVQALIRMFEESILTADRVQCLLMPHLNNSRYNFFFYLK